MPTGVYVRKHKINRPKIPLEDRFWTKVRKTETCWVWTADLNEKGYGKISKDQYPEYAHRVAYELVKGPIPEGLELDHLCRNHACVNPAHLEPVTRTENQHRGDGTIGAKNLAKTHCPRGHPYSGDNLFISNLGQRRCRTCKRDIFGPRERLKKRLAREGTLKSRALTLATDEPPLAVRLDDYPSPSDSRDGLTDPTA